MKILELQTKKQTEFVDITAKIAAFVDENNCESGIVTVFCPHTTAGITVNENWDPDVQHDLLLKMNEVFAADPRFRHNEGNSDAHLKTSLFGASQTLIVQAGKLQLGKWQGVYFVEWDGPRTRKVFLECITKQ